MSTDIIPFSVQHMMPLIYYNRSTSLADGYTYVERLFLRHGGAKLYVECIERPYADELNFDEEMDEAQMVDFLDRAVEDGRLHGCAGQA